MDIKALKLELLQKLGALNDANVLASTNRYRDMLLSGTPGQETSTAVFTAKTPIVKTGVTYGPLVEVILNVAARPAAESIGTTFTL